jgi:hypothetical protein
MPDHWLIEVSGIPFGLTGQMLHEGGNPWRGMVYGITNRPGWFEPAPTGIWNFWDEHQVMDKTFIGYWEEHIAVSCDNPNARASFYKGNDESWIAVANWSAEDLSIAIDVDYVKLGYDEKNCNIYLPGIPDFQEQRMDINADKLILPGGKGLIIVISP